MKRTIVVLSILALAAVIFPAVSIVAQPSHVPHEDPATAGDSSSSLLLLLFHGDIFDLAVKGDFRESQNLLAQVRYANIPGDLQYIATRLDVMVGDLLKALDELEYLMDEATTQLSQYHIEEAKQYLDRARVVLGEAEGIYESIEMAVVTLGDRVGIVSTLPSSELRQAYNRLYGLYGQLQQLLDQFNLNLEQLYNDYETRAGVKLLPTHLTLEVTPESVYVGDNVTVSGQLTGDDSPLENRMVTLFHEDEQIEVVTDGEGYFSAEIGIPYEYVDSTFFEARYWPAGEDIGVYAASKSSRVTVEILYYGTSLRLMAPEVAYPGLPVIVVVEIMSSNEETAERKVTLLLDDTPVTGITVQERSRVDLVLPEDTGVGDHVLTAVVSPEGRYAGASQQVDLRISKMTMHVDIQAPSLILLPRQVRVRGHVYDNDLEPVARTAVRIEFGTSPEVVVETSSDGGFNALIDAPLDLSLAGPQKLTVTVEPPEPYYSTFTVDKWIVAVNPVGISLMLCGIISVGLLVYRRVSSPSKPGRDLSEPVSGGLETPGMPTIAPPMRPKQETDGVREKVWEAYLEGLDVVEKAAGIHLGSNNTLRGFFIEAVSRVETDIRPSFGKLTVLTEVALYSSHEMDENAVTDARQLAADIKKEIG